MRRRKAKPVVASERKDRLLAELDECFQSSAPIRHSAAVGIPQPLRALVTLFVGLVQEGAVDAGASSLTPAASLKAVSLDLSSAVDVLGEVEEMPGVTSRMVTRAREARRLVEKAIARLEPPPRGGAPRR